MQIIITTSILLVVYFMGYFIIIASNYRYNRYMENNTISTLNRVINDQNGPTGHAFRYGLHPASFNACEAIAVHNVKVLLGQQSNLAEVMRQFQLSLGMVGYGIGGSNVYLVGRMLKKNGIPNRPVKFNNLNRQGIYIISYFNDGKLLKGIHTVTVAYDGNTYTVYNLRGKAEYKLTSLDFAKRYVCGFFIEQNLQNDKKEDN